MQAYRIRDWHEHYENNRTAEMKVMRWVPFPNKHDGDGYTQMVEGPEGAAMIGAFMQTVLVASKCTPRGTLLRESGTLLRDGRRQMRAHDAASIARIVRLEQSTVAKMLELASSENVGWIEMVEVEEIQEFTEIPQEPAEIPQEGAPRVRAREWKGREGNGIEEKKNTPPTPLPGGLQIPEFQQVWNDWLKHLSQKPKSKRPTESALQKQLAKCAAWGADRAIAAIITSIEHNWQSLYEEKLNGNGAPHGNYQTPADVRRAAKAAKECPENLQL